MKKVIFISISVLALAAISYFLYKKYGKKSVVTITPLADMQPINNSETLAGNVIIQPGSGRG